MSNLTCCMMRCFGIIIENMISSLHLANIAKTLQHWTNRLLKYQAMIGNVTGAEACELVHIVPRLVVESFELPRIFEITPWHNLFGATPDVIHMDKFPLLHFDCSIVILARNVCNFDTVVCWFQNPKNAECSNKITNFTCHYQSIYWCIDRCSQLTFQLYIVNSAACDIT